MLCAYASIDVFKFSANEMTKNRAHPKHIRWSRIRYTKPMMATIKLIFFLKARRRIRGEQPLRGRVWGAWKEAAKVFDVTLPTFFDALCVWRMVVLLRSCFFALKAKLFQCFALTFFFLFRIHSLNSTLVTNILGHTIIFHSAAKCIQI